MSSTKSLFERFDDISASTAEILNEIGAVNQKADDASARLASLEKEFQSFKQGQRTTQTVRQSVPRENPIKTFARTAKKSWRWFGNRKEFKRTKCWSIFTDLLVLILGFISTIITGISCGMYSPFSSIENIWLVFGIIYLAFAFKSRIVLDVDSFAAGNPYRVARDNDTGMVFPNGGEKRVFKVFRWITFVTVIVNIIWIWMHKSDLSALATIFEILFFLSIIASFIVNLLLHAQYSIGCLEGKNFTTGEKVTLLKMPGFKNFALEKDVREKFPQLFE